MEGFLWAVLAALLAGAAYLAYEHPDDYRRFVAGPVTTVAIVGSLLAFAFSMGLMFGRIQALQALPNLPDADAALIEAIRDPIWPIWAMCALFVICLWFLVLLQVFGFTSKRRRE